MKQLFCAAMMVVAFVVGSVMNASGQTDATLFTVAGTPVTVSEFEYIYKKTNGDKADFSKKSVEEYLDLYAKFKLKVRRAREMKLDTVESLREELSGYRRQLSESYLTDREVTDKLVREAYERMQKDIKISHILIKIDKNDTLAAFKKIKDIEVRLQKGEKFETLATTMSEDETTKKQNGLVGFVTAMLPDGFYVVENAAYQTAIGKVSDVVRSPLGYHLILVNAQRSARGEMEAAHILLRKTKEGVAQPNAKQRIDSIYQALKAGGNFDDLAKKLSDDTYSSPRGGYLGVFGINRYEAGFEEAAFALTKDGDYSMPYESSIGYHIILRKARKPLETYDLSKLRLKSKVQRDGRFELSKQSLVERIKRESNYKASPGILDMYAAKVDSSFLQIVYKADAYNTSEQLFTLGTDKVLTKDFVDYAVANGNRRFNYAQQGMSPGQAAKALYNDFLNEKLLAYEEKQLERKYPEFKSLMREYEEGILLFEAIKQNVWDKASQDTVGLEQFFATRKGKYMWSERANVTFYSLADSAKAEIAELRKFAEKNDPQATLKKFNKTKEILVYKAETIEKGKNKAVDAVWKAGALTTNENSPRDNSFSFAKIENVLPPAAKTLKEARGYVVADYQDALEKKWIEDLTKSYPVVMNKEALKSIIKQ